MGWHIFTDRGCNRRSDKKSKSSEPSVLDMKLSQENLRRYRNRAVAQRDEQHTKESAKIQSTKGPTFGLTS